MLHFCPKSVDEGEILDNRRSGPCQKVKPEYEPNDSLPDQVDEKGIPFRVIGIN